MTVTKNDLGYLYSALADHLCTLEFIEHALDDMSDPRRKATIMTWLKDHEINCDIDFILNFDRLELELKTAAFPCPRCNKEMDEYRNVGREHYGICLQCNVCFALGSNLFSSWKDETMEVWEKNKEYLSQFGLIEPDGEIYTF